jgi:hypothetical protein
MRLLTGIALLVMLGCRPTGERLHLTSEAPDGTMQLKIWKQLRWPAIQIRIDLQKEGNDIEIHRDPETAVRSVGLAEVAWNEKAANVGILICGAGSPEMIIGFDTAKLEKIPLESVEDNLRQNLTVRYKPAPHALAEAGGDPIRWVCSADLETYERFREIVGEDLLLPNLSK